MSYATYGIINAPDSELNRSPAAQVIAQLSKKSELFLTHFEYRHHLALPTQWMTEDRPDLNGEVQWKSGVLEEHKYLHFRYDQPLGSFHPGHRAKWTMHELCHGLLGFTWSPQATPFHNILAARLSELLPVALWYFFDEVQLRRCPLHYLQGALFQDYCIYCEKAALQGPRLPEKEDHYFIENGINFIKAELAAIMRSRRFARPLPHRYATLDLNSDAMAYVAQNTARMEDESFRLFVELFHGPHTGMWQGLDELEDRLWGLTESLTGGLPSNPLRAGKAHWIAQDIAWRLLTVAAQCEADELVDHLYQMVEELARTPQAVHLVIQQYQALHEDYFLPSPQQVFAVGYDLGGGWGWDESQVIAGVASACPELTRAIGLDILSEQVSAFIPWDLAQARRIPIGKRFAQFLRETAPGPLSDLASYEAYIQHPDPPDPWSASLAWKHARGDLVRRCQGVEVLHVGIEIDRLLESIQQDQDIDIPEYEHALLIVNRAGGHRNIIEISSTMVQALKDLEKQPMAIELLGLRQEDIELLKEVGAITPCEWQLYHDDWDGHNVEAQETNAHYDEHGLLPDAVDLSQLGHFNAQEISHIAQSARTQLSQHTSRRMLDALSPAQVSTSSIAKFPLNIDALSDIINQSQFQQEEREIEAVQRFQDELHKQIKQMPPSDHSEDHAFSKSKERELLPTQPLQAHASEEFVIDEERPVENSFEEKLRQELNRQRAEQSSPFPQLIAVGEDLSLYEELFDFKDFFKDNEDS